MGNTQLFVGVASVVAGIGLLLRSGWIASVLIGESESGLARLGRSSPGRVRSVLLLIGAIVLVLGVGMSLDAVAN